MGRMVKIILLVGLGIFCFYGLAALALSSVKDDEFLDDMDQCDTPHCKLCCLCPKCSEYREFTRRRKLTATREPAERES